MRVLGLDIGIASVGWGLIDTNEHKIINSGVRIFTAAEHPKTGESLAKPRREARSTRRRIRRKKHRLERLRKLFTQQQLTSQKQHETLFLTDKKKIDVWLLRYEALNRKLSSDELARILYHIARRRGFKSNRKTEAKDQETGKQLTAIKENSERLENYRTVGEMFYRDRHYIDKKRNSQNNYEHTISRAQLIDEIKTIFELQRGLGNTRASKDFEHEYLNIFTSQRPFSTPEMLLKMVGYCSLEGKPEKRAPKYSYHAERFVLVSKINNLTITERGHRSQHLDSFQKQKIKEMAYRLKSVSFHQIRNEIGLHDDARFIGLNYSQAEKAGKNAETEKFITLKGFHELKARITKAQGKQAWENMVLNPDRIDAIVHVLTYHKASDHQLREGLEKLDCSEEAINELLSLSFSQNINLSIKAIKKLLPRMELGIRYDEACTQEYGSHSHLNNNIEKTRLLPIINQDDIRNPVVFRALTQCRKLINAIIREHGSPHRIHIELSRELSKPYSERKQIERKQAEFRSQKQKAIEHFQEILEVDVEPGGLDLLKFRLWKEQKGFCPYSGQYMEPCRLLNTGYVDIDHILPYSRTMDDSMNNKVLCLARENRQKGNKTPWEYILGQQNSEKRWLRLESTIQHYKHPRKWRMLKKELNEEDAKEFKERNINDTRYIARFLKHHIETHLLLTPIEGEGKKQQIQTNNGALTSLLRARWGLIKIRSEGDLHHAVDALVVAASTQSMIKRISDFSRKRELWEHDQRGSKTEEIIDRETGEITKTSFLKQKKKHFPMPWEGFREDVLEKVNQDIFVSRMPRRKVTGQAHKETTRSAKQIHDSIAIVKKPLRSLTAKNLESLHDKNRNHVLYETLLKRLEEHGGKADKAFAEPIYMPTKSGKQGPEIKSIKLEDTIKDGVYINQGIADHANMIRVDVFKKDGKNFLVPIYVADFVKGELPNRAIVANKSRDLWIDMSDDYHFSFSLYPNDLISFKHKNDNFKGYYRSTHSGTAAIYIDAHDRQWRDKQFGSKLLKNMKKYEVDLLGNHYEIKQEKRRGLE